LVSGALRLSTVGACTDEVREEQKTVPVEHLNGDRMCTMKTLLYVWIAAVLVCAAAFGQSLGDVARQSRETPRKKAARSYDDDSLPKKRSVSPAQESTAPPAIDAKSTDEKDATQENDSKAKDAAAPTGEGEMAQDSKKESTDDEKSGTKASEAAKAQIEQQKQTINLLQRELDVATKEAQIQATAYYADAGNRLRDTKAWAEQAKKSQDTIDEKTKALQEAKDKLDELLEEARKAGVPSSYTE